MKNKIVAWLVTVLLLATFHGAVFQFPVFANASSCSLEQFALHNINQNKTWTNLGCFASFDQASAAMNNHQANYNDLVITHEASSSPLKIIKASRAVAASYPFRKGNSSSNYNTVNIYRNSNLSGDSTYMTYHLDMAYYDTVSYNAENGTGSAKVQISGFVGYIPLLQIDILPLIYIENGWEITLGGNTYLETEHNKDDQEQPFTLVPRMNEYRVATNSALGVKELYHQTFSFWDGRSYGTNVIGLAPDWMSDGTYYSWDGIHFYYDRATTQPVNNGNSIGEYYNYYLYLPLRSTSNYTAADLDAYLNSKSFTSTSVMKGEGQAFIDAQNAYGMNALLVYALAIHESNHGLSSLAKNKNNLFGWGAYDANPGDAYEFESIAQSVSEHVGINLRGYLSVENWRFFGQAYGNKENGLNTKYASDPYWGNKIASHAYSIDRYHNYKDYAQHAFGVINKNATITVKKQASNASDTLVSLSSKLNNQTMLIANTFKEDTYTYHEVMSPMPVINGSAIQYKDIFDEKVEYDWSTSSGYLINESIDLVYDGFGFPNKPNVINPSLLQSPSKLVINQLKVVDNKIVLGGYHAQAGLSVENPNQITHQLTLLSHTSEPTNVTLTSTTDTSINNVMNDSRYESSHMGFLGQLDVSNLAVGIYTMQMESTVSISKQPIVYSNRLSKENASLTFSINNKTYTLFSNASNALTLSVNHQTATDVLDTQFLRFDAINTKQSLILKQTDGTTFVSSDPEIASVSEAGEVTANASGTTTVLIKQGDVVKSSVGVVVDVVVNGLSVNETSISFTKKDQVKALVVRSASDQTIYPYASFVSLNPTVATVNSEGLVTPKLNGKATILIQSKLDPSLRKEVLVSVAYSLEGVVANPNKLVFNRFEVKRMILNLSPMNAIAHSFTYSSSNESVATVNAQGDIQPKTNGTTTITAKASNGKTATLSVVVDIQGAPDVMLGDVNGDGLVDVLDLAKTSRYLAELDSLTGNNKLAADLNQDGLVDVLDLAKLSRVLAELE